MHFAMKQKAPSFLCGQMFLQVLAMVSAEFISGRQQPVGGSNPDVKVLGHFQLPDTGWGYSRNSLHVSMMPTTDEVPPRGGGID